MNFLAPAVVYLLCLAASSFCAFLLLRSWRRARIRLLMWAALGFGFLALNNLFLFLDMIVFPDVPLLWARQTTQLAAVGVLLFGFIREAE